MVIDVTDENFEKEVLKSTLPVLIDLWAPWCAPCRMIAPTVEKLSGQYENKVKFCRMNIDENPKTPPKYRVMSIPTLLFIKDGKIKDTVIGLVQESALKPKIDALL